MWDDNEVGRIQCGEESSVVDQWGLIDIVWVTRRQLKGGLKNQELEGDGGGIN